MAMEDTSITMRAYELLRADIIDCRLQPGSRLNISQLQSKLSLSQAAVREALSRLTAEGLVEIERHRGFRVANVSASGFRELTQALLTVELPCLRASIANGSSDWELNLVSTYHRSHRTLELVVAGKEDINAYSNERLGFYNALLGACDNSWLLWTWHLLYAQNMRYRQMYMPLAKFELNLNPHHEAFLKAALARDVEGAVALSVKNYDMVSRFVEEAMAEQGGDQKLPPKNPGPVAGKKSVGVRSQAKPVRRRSTQLKLAEGEA